jgi:hypothetical protein
MVQVRAKSVTQVNIMMSPMQRMKHIASLARQEKQIRNMAGQLLPIARNASNISIQIQGLLSARHAGMEPGAIQHPQRVLLAMFRRNAQALGNVLIFIQILTAQSVLTDGITWSVFSVISAHQN